MKINERIKKYRKDLKLTQKQLAGLVGVKHNTISDWENGRTSPDTDSIILLCEIFRVNADEILGLASESPSLNRSELQILTNHRQLNPQGQEKLLEYSDDLVSSGKYKKHGSSGVGEENAC